MKKKLSMILAVMMLLGLCACGNSGTQTDTTGGEAATFRVGFGRENITPDFPVALSGGGDPNRISESVIDYIYTTCIAITDTVGKTVLLITTDVQSVGFKAAITKAVNEATGIAEENVILCTTHNHSGPAQSTTKEGGKEFL